MFTAHITTLIASADGTIRPDFAASSPDDWAASQMFKRYNQVVSDSDGPGDFPRICFEKLRDERVSLSTWFNEADGKLSPTLQSVFMVNRLAGPIDDGIGWDFRPDGSPEQRMLVFKGTLLAVWRAAGLIAPKDRTVGNMQFGGLATLVKSAYTERAKLHTWRGYQPENDPRRFTGLEMSHRWVAHRSFLFLLRMGAPERWAWEISGSLKAFGPFEEKKGLL